MPSMPNSNARIKLFSTAPQSREVDKELYLGKLVQISQWSEQEGFEGILIYTDNSLVDPWLIAQVIRSANYARAELRLSHVHVDHP